MKHFLILSLISIFILSSCSKTEEVVVTPEKTPFLIQTQWLSQASSDYTVTKSARITAGSSLTIASEGIGTVRSIPVKEWARIKVGSNLIELWDTVWQYNIRLRQAQNSLEWQYVNEKNTIISLNQAISDAEVAYEQSLQNYTTLRSDMEERKKKAEQDLYNANPQNSGSTAAINIEKLRLDLEKANTDYRTLVGNLDETYEVYLRDIEKTIGIILTDTDKILGITDGQRNYNDAYESALGARGVNDKNDAETLWRGLQNELKNTDFAKNVSTDEANIESQIAVVGKAYESSRRLVNKMSSLLNNTVAGGNLPQSQIDGWIALYTGYKNTLSSTEAGFTNWKTQSANNITSQKIAIDALKSQIALTEKNLSNGNNDTEIAYNRTLIDIEDKVKLAEIALEKAKNNIAIAKDRKTVGISQLQVSKENAAIEVEKGRKDVEKLYVRSPIEWVVTKVIATLWQSVNAGTPMIEISSDSPEILIELEYSVVSSLSVGDSLGVMVDNRYFTGSIRAISSVANSSLLYTTRISVPEASDYLGSAASITFSLSKDETSNTSTFGIILPLRSVKIISEQEWEIAILSQSGGVERKSVRLGKLRGENIEILDTLPANIEIILTDISNYDPKKNTIQKNNTSISR
jgi:multidrug resistance efflux pump